MPLHFTLEEFAERRRRALDAMAARGLDALLMFKQESMYWLTGYDSFGYCFFQCLVLRADGDLVLLTRAPDLRQAQHTSLIEDIRIWVDREGSDPARQLRELLAEQGPGRQAARRRVRQLRADRGQRQAASTRRSTASPRRAMRRTWSTGCAWSSRAAEIACVRRAAELADAALDAAIAETSAGADEGRILAAMQGAVLRGRRRLPGQPVHHRLRPRRAALPLQVRAPPARRRRTS